MAGSIISFNTLVDEMTKTDVMKSFDVIVSYREKALSDLMEKAQLNFSDACLHHDYTFSTDDLNGADNATISITVKFDLTNPKLELRDEQAMLSFEIANGMITLPHKSKKIPDNSKIIFTCPLASLSGLVDKDGKISSTTQAAAGATSTVPTSNEHDKTGFAGVTLDFSKGSVSVPDPVPADIEGKIRRAFTDQKTFYLAGVKNGTDSVVVAANQLQPTAFFFSVIPTDPAHKDLGATLCMWISTQGAGHAPKYPAVSFSPKTAVRSPIPDNASASIIFARAQIVEHGFQTAGQDRTVRDETEGFSCLTDVAEKDVSVKATSFGDYGTTTHMKEFSFKFGSPKPRIQVMPSIAAKPKLSWLSDSIAVDGESTSRSPNVNSGGVNISRSDLTLWYRFRTENEGKWTLSDRQIGLDFSEKKDKFTVDTISDSKDGSDNRRHADGIWQELTKSGIPDNYANLVVPEVSTENKFTPINYFLTTNLLLPGRKVFEPKPVNDGLAMPNDLIITGEIAKNIN